MSKKAFLTLCSVFFGLSLFAQHFGISDDSLYLIRKNKQFGFIDYRGNEIIKPQYAFATAFANSRALVLHQGEHIYINAQGEPVIPTKQYVMPFSYGLRPQQVENAWGFGDTNYRLPIPFQFQEVGHFREGFAWVKKENVYGFIDTEGRYTVMPQYEKARNYQEGRAAVMMAVSLPKTKSQPVVVAMKRGFHQEFLIRERIRRDTVAKDSLVLIRVFKPNPKKSTLGMEGFDTLTEYIKMPIKHITFHVERDTLPNLSEMPPTEIENTTEKVWKWGFIDKNGAIAIPALYNEVGNFRFGMAYATENGKYGYLDKKGKWKIEPTFDSADDFQTNGMAKIIKNGKTFFIDTLGNALFSIPIANVRVTTFKNGFAKITAEDRFGFINEKGKIITPISFDVAYDFEPSGIAVVANAGNYGLIDTNGHYLLPLMYDDIGEFHHGFAKIRKNQKIGFINTQGKIVIPLAYENASDFNKEKFAMISIKRNVYKIDTLGNSLARLISWKNLSHEKWEIEEESDKELKKLPLEIGYEDEFASVTAFSEGFAVVPINGKAGFIDNRGIVVIPPIFEEAQSFSEELAPVRIGDKWGYIDYQGERVIQPNYLYAMKFKDGIAKVYLDFDHAIYIDKTGKEIKASKVNPILKQVPDDFWKTGKTVSDRAIFFDKGSQRYGYKDGQGKTVIKADFDNACDFSNGRALIEMEGLWFYINKNGEAVWQELE
ncbi:MAG: WG repeat-containing protein [Bacteroidia bacterium]